MVGGGMTSGKLDSASNVTVCVVSSPGPGVIPVISISCSGASSSMEALLMGSKNGGAFVSSTDTVKSFSTKSVPSETRTTMTASPDIFGAGVKVIAPLGLGDV